MENLGIEQPRGIISPSSLSSSQNNWSPTGLGTASIVRIAASADVSITGIVPKNGQVLRLFNVSTKMVTLASESASSTAANRFAFVRDVVLLPNDCIQLWYDDASTRWRPCGANSAVAEHPAGLYHEPLTNGAQTLPRWSAQADFLTGVSQRLCLAYFNNRQAFTASRIAVVTGDSGASGLTLVRFGIYSVAANGNLTLEASTPNDTALLTAAYTGYTKSLSATFNMLAGTRYAVGALQVGTTPAKLQAGWAQVQWLGTRPRLCASLDSQSNLPSSPTDASLGDTDNAFYAAVLTA